MNNIVNDSGHSCHAGVSATPEAGLTAKPLRERFSAPLGSLCASPRGYGGTPMATLLRPPGARGTRAQAHAVPLVDCLDAAPRIGRGMQLLSFAGNAVMRPRLRSRPVKRLFAGASTLFFIARNEGSSMVSNDYSCIHRIKYNRGNGHAFDHPFSIPQLPFASGLWDICHFVR